MRGDRDPRLPDACVRCGKEVGLPYNPDDWVMRLDPSSPTGVVALCPECAAAADEGSPSPGAAGRRR